MREIDKTYNIYDGTIGIWRVNVNDEVRETFDEIRMMMMNDGWTFHQDPKIKKHYRCIANNHHAGRKQDVHFLSSIAGRHIEFRFYEDVIRDNQHGGQYTTHKLKSMPYLLRLKVQIAIDKLVAYLKPLGYTDKSRTYPAEGLAAIMKHRAELEDFQGKDFYSRERLRYNCADAHGVEMFDGDVRYFWSYTGRLQRGIVYRNINNMWWVHTGPFSYSNQANFSLFTWKAGMGSRRKLSDAEIEKRLRAQLEIAINKEKFERCIVLRNLLRKERAA